MCIAVEDLVIEKGVLGSYSAV